MIEARLNITLHKNQQYCHDNGKKFTVIKAGKRFGKTKMAIYRALQKAGRIPGGVVWYVAPTYKQAKQIAWWETLAMLPSQWVKRKLETDLMFELFNQCRFHLIGADNEDSLRGPKIHHLAMDEASFQKEHIWPSILSGQLLGGDGSGSADFISSPNPEGRNWFTSFHEDAKRRMAAGDPDWAAFFYTIYDNPTLKLEEIEKLRNMIPDDKWQLEYMAQESDYAGTLYSEFDFGRHVHEVAELDGMLLVMGLDWGISHPTACLWIYVDPVKQKIYVSDEFMKTGFVIQESCSHINRITGDRAVEWRVIDPSTAKRNSQTGRRDMDEFARYGVTCVPGDNRDRGYDITKMMFKRNMIKIHPKCRNLISQLRMIQRGDTTGEDMLDCLRYACVRIHDFMFGGKLFDAELLKTEFKRQEFGGPISLYDPDMFPQKAKATGNSWITEEIVG